MKTNKDFMLREVAGEYILIPTGGAAQKINGMIRLTETAAYIWKQIDTTTDLAGIEKKVMEEFEVDERTAKQDVHGFMKGLYLYNIVKDIPELEEELKREKEEEQQ